MTYRAKATRRRELTAGKYHRYALEYGTPRTSDEAIRAMCHMIDAERELTLRRGSGLAIGSFTMGCLQGGR